MKPPNANPASLPNSVLEAALDLWGQAREQHLIPITGRSMLPVLQDGDRVLVAHGCTGVRRGDVVVFRHAGGLVAHRVLRLYAGDAGPTFVTKGDNAPQFDPPLNAGEIVGRALAVERDGRRMSLDTAAWRMAGWSIAAGTLGWIMLYGWGRRFKRKLLGPQPNRVTAFLRRQTLACFALALAAVQAVICRWKE